MSDLSSTSCYKDRNDGGFSPILLILILCMCGGDNGLFGGSCGGNDGCGCGNGLEGILPLILILSLCGGGGGLF